MDQPTYIKHNYIATETNGDKLHSEKTNKFQKETYEEYSNIIPFTEVFGNEYIDLTDNIINQESKYLSPIKEKGTNLVNGKPYDALMSSGNYEIQSDNYEHINIEYKSASKDTCKEGEDTYIKFNTDKEIQQTCKGHVEVNIKHISDSNYSIEDINCENNVYEELDSPNEGTHESSKGDIKTLQITENLNRIQTEQKNDNKKMTNPIVAQIRHNNSDIIQIKTNVLQNALTDEARIESIYDTMQLKPNADIKHNGRHFWKKLIIILLNITLCVGGITILFVTVRKTTTSLKEPILEIKKDRVLPTYIHPDYSLLIGVQFRIKKFMYKRYAGTKVMLVRNEIWYATERTLQKFSPDVELLQHINLTYKYFQYTGAVLPTSYGNLIVVDIGRNIYLLNHIGEPITTLLEGKYSDIAEYNGKVYALEKARSMIMVLEHNGTIWLIVNEITLLDSKNNIVPSLYCIFVHDNIYITSIVNEDILYIFNRHGILLSKHGTKGVNKTDVKPGSFYRPFHCSVDKQGSILIADTYNYHLQLLIRNKEWVTIDLPQKIINVRHKPRSAVVSPDARQLWWVCTHGYNCFYKIVAV